MRTVPPNNAMQRIAGQIGVLVATGLLWLLLWLLTRYFEGRVRALERELGCGQFDPPRVQLASFPSMSRLDSPFHFPSQLLGFTL